MFCALKRILQLCFLTHKPDHTGDIGVCANNETVPYYDRRMDFGLPGYGAFGIDQVPQSLFRC